MNNNNISNTIPEHPITALATPPYKSALAVIRITGTGCIKLFSSFVIITDKSIPFEQRAANHTIYSTIHNPTTKQILDEVMITVYRAPKSYTGQDLIEISLHGSMVGIHELLSALYAHGFEPAEAGEFTRRAFLNGKLDLTQAEAIHALIDANTSTAHTIALQQLGGSITHYIDAIKQSIVELSAICSITLDYPEDEIQEDTTLDYTLIESLILQLDNAIHSYDLSRIHREGAVVVVSGKTNAGKSSLFNALLKEDRAIVSNIHGTTRDFIESQVQIKDIPLRLYDTAGLRITTAQVEQQGIEKSYKLLSSADSILYTIDATANITQEDYTQLSIFIYEDNINPSRIIIVWNKIDSDSYIPAPETIEISSKDNTQHISIPSTQIIPISALQYTHLNTLQNAIYNTIGKNNLPLQEDTVVINSLRQKQHLEQCKTSLQHVKDGLDQGYPLDMISLDLHSALTALGNITGEVSNEDILDVMFSNFCVGK